MPHTNQLIEELSRKFNNDLALQLKPSNDTMIAVRTAKGLFQEALKQALSQTEQECDKKWRERIRGKRRDNVFVPDHSPSMHGGLVCRACGGQEDCRCEYYNEAIDDLLNNK